MKPLLEKATRQHTKLHNNRLVLRTIYEQGEISRAELARLTGLTRTTISEVVTNLIERGLVQEVGHGPSAGGRSPILLNIVEDSRHVIGINLASSEIHAAYINMRGDIRHHITRPISSRDGESVLAQLYSILDELTHSPRSKLAGIGIGTPGVIDTANGIVRQAVNTGWQDLPLRNLIQARYHLPVYVANDSHTAALADYTFGSSQNVANLVVVKVGQGIGAGIVLDGHLFYGDSYGAGEIGHLMVVEHGKLCSCGHYGCLETVASTRAIVQQAQELARETPTSLLHRHAAAVEAIDLNAVIRAFEDGDPSTHQLISTVGHYLGIAIANIVGILNIQRIVITGRIAPFGPVLQEVIKREIQHRALGQLARETTVVFTSLSPDSIILGAAAFLLTYELGLGRIRKHPRSLMV